MAYSDIEVALLQKLSDTNLSPIQYPNMRPITEASSQTFARCWMLSNPVKVSSLGPNGINRSEGIFQVNVHAPIGSGRSSWINTIYNAFIRQTLTYGDASVHVDEVRVAAPIDDESHLVYPIDIIFTAYL